ncbi:MAG: twin-arginine translocase TatA/TatE family subunit [Vicinamibacteria bacterium]|nr:twin-arginine translocase TatA/TatE family subunit [Vicinamibacteria bacterium]
MFGLGVQELVIILVIVVLLFGASRLPKLGGAVGQTLRNFRQGLKGEDSVKSEESEATHPTKESTKRG